MLVLWTAAARSQVPGAAFEKEVEKQEAVYRSRGENVPTGYVVDRSLLAYASFLPAGFDRSLADLGPADRWLDIGAGEGKAILDYYTSRYDAMHPGRRGKKARAVAMSIEDRRTPRWNEAAAGLEANQISYLFGRRLRDYSPEELGRFQLITDFNGGFSYSRFLSVFMERTLAVLELNGSFYTLLLDVVPQHAPQDAVHPDTLLLTEIVKPDGSDVGVCSWLKSIRCAQVTCEADLKSKRPVELYRVQKVCNSVTVPALDLVQYRAGTPPQRRYQVKTPSAVRAEWEIDQ